jgi:putative PEP-CTERM system histidine kinase
MLENIGLFTYGTASASFAALGLLLALLRGSNPLNLSLMIACITTALSHALLAASSVSTAMPTTLIDLGELTRNGCWLFVLLQLLGLQSDGNSASIRGRHWRRAFFVSASAALLLVTLQSVFSIPGPDADISSQLIIIMWLLFALLGLLIIEQLFRNATPNARWSIKYLCLGLGIVFVYDFFIYAEALLFLELDAELWQARGLVHAIATPLLAVSIIRSNDWRVNLQISHQVAFHTATLIGAGLYLLGMAAAGYAIRYLGGSWGGVLQTGFLAAAAVLLALLLFSGKLRAQTRAFLNKHFFSYRYDYREEWLKFTQALGGLDDNVAEGIIRTMAPLASSPGGVLWASSDDDQPMHVLAHWQMRLNQPGAGLERLPDWLLEHDWVIDLTEWRRSPDIYENLELPAWLQQEEQIWLVIPLIFRDRLQAVLMLARTDIKSSLNWEDRDLLKTAGRQAATHLAQHLTSKALVEARQFDAFNRLSAYVVHDLKNILAQQSLIVSNAKKHRNNPAFIDDMISTVDNSVARMRRLMEQMRSGVRGGPTDRVSLKELLQDVIAGRATSRPVPHAEFGSGEKSDGEGEPAADSESSPDFAVEADRDRLATVFNHLIQNAQEATDDQGQVLVRLDCAGNTVTVAIEDTGSGMTAEFVRSRLFRPFESTKGLTGMGIGAFESREYIRQLGGDITVDSTPGKGTTFCITIPRRADDFPSSYSAQHNAVNPVQSGVTTDVSIGNGKSET